MDKANIQSELPDLRFGIIPPYFTLHLGNGPFFPSSDLSFYENFKKLNEGGEAMAKILQVEDGVNNLDDIVDLDGDPIEVVLDGKSILKDDPDFVRQLQDMLYNTVNPTDLILDSPGLEFQDGSHTSNSFLEDLRVLPLGFDEYQRQAATTAIYSPAKGLEYTALGLAGEAGEVAGKVSKVIRDADGVLTEQRRNDIMDELSDVTWFLAMAIKEIGFTFSEVAQHNLDKLAGRKARGVLAGDGDNR